MSTVDGSPSIAVPRLSADEVDRLRVTSTRVVRSEWRKTFSVRSTWITLGLAVLFLIGIGSAIAWSTANDWDSMRPRQKRRFDALASPMSGFYLSQLAIGVLAVLLVAGEYSGGMIRASLGAVPKRLPVLWAKLLVFCTVTLATTTPAAVATFFLAQSLLAEQGIDTTWDAPDVARSVIGVGLYLTVVAAFAIGLGAIIRNVAGAIAALVGVLMVLPVVALALPDTWFDRVYKWLPSNAGQALLAFGSQGETLAPWHGFAVFCGYAAATLIVAAVLLRRRDA
jgi:ABC-type transport system involved in multi-copper enzyme maturation permease subunit